MARGKIGVKFEKSGEWKWRARRDRGVLLPGFYFDFFFILFLPCVVLQWHSLGLSPPPRQTPGSLSVLVSGRALPWHGCRAGMLLIGAPRIFLLIDISGRKTSPEWSHFGLGTFLPSAVQTEAWRSSGAALTARCGVSVPHSCSLFPPW